MKHTTADVKKELEMFWAAVRDTEKRQPPLSLPAQLNPQFYVGKHIGFHAFNKVVEKLSLRCWPAAEIIYDAHHKTYQACGYNVRTTLIEIIETCQPLSFLLLKQMALLSRCSRLAKQQRDSTNVQDCA